MEEQEKAILSFQRPLMSRKEFHNSIKQILNEAIQEDCYLPTVRRLGETSLFFFCVYILGWTYLDNDFAYALCGEVHRKKYGRIWILAREHYKSTIITIASTIREICVNPEGTRIIYSNNFDSAKDLFYAPIKNALQTNAVLKGIYPNVLFCDGEKPTIWNSSELNVKRQRESKEFTLACRSLTAQATGSHYEYLIYDDCVTPEDVGNAEIIEATKQQWRMSINTGVTENLNMVVIGTFYHYQELYNMIISEDILELILQPCVDKHGTPVHMSQKSLDVKRKTMGSAVYATQMLCDPKQSSAKGFKTEWIQYWSRQTFTGLNIYILVDPAGKVARKRDNTVMWVIGVDSGNSYYVIDLIHDKLDLKGRTDALFRLVRLYHPKNIYYEQQSMQADVEHIKEEQERINFRFKIAAITQSIEKGMRIEALQPLFENGRIYFPSRIIHRNWEGKDEDVIHRFIEDEYKIYPYCSHDDDLDSLSFICHKSVRMERPDELSMEQELYGALAMKIGKENMVPLEGEVEYKPW